jgi:alkylhydroperoxidase family enzyme
VPEEDLNQFAAAGYAERHLLDVLTIVALKTLSNYVSHIAHTPLDVQFAAQSWKSQVATVA